MPVNEHFNALRDEYLTLSRKLYSKLEKGCSEDELDELKQMINTLLQRIKELDDSDPADLIRE